MNVMLKSISAIALSLTAVSAFAEPGYLITHNNTDVESNAYVGGSTPSPYPTPAHNSRQIPWGLVRLACWGNTTNGRCPAKIMMATNTNNPVELGWVSMELESGDISPKKVSGNGYTLVVNGPGEATVTKD